MGKTRRVAERMILERADRARRIGAALRAIAQRLETVSDGGPSADGLKADAESLSALAGEVERL